MPLEVQPAVKRPLTSLVTESLLGLNVLAQYFVDKPETVPGNFDKLLAKYPYVNTKLVFTGPRESPFLHSARGSFLRHQGHIDSALASFRESHKYSVALDPELKQFAATTSYQIGYCLFLKYEWLEASKEIQHFLSGNLLDLVILKSHRNKDKHVQVSCCIFTRSMFVVFFSRYRFRNYAESVWLV